MSPPLQTQMKRILVAYDGGKPARRALDMAIELAERFDALISVVSVVPYRPGRSLSDPMGRQRPKTRSPVVQTFRPSNWGCLARCSGPVGRGCRVGQPPTVLTEVAMTGRTPGRRNRCRAVMAAVVWSVVGCGCGPVVSPSTPPSLPTSWLATPSISGSFVPTGSPEATATPRPTARPTAAPRPTPRPTAPPLSTATPRSTPTPRAQPAASRLVRHGSRTGNDIALTFDMGGRVGDALSIVRWLIDHDVHASIFMTGAMAANPNTDAGRQVLALVDAHPDLFRLGNHSYTHRDFRTLDAAEIRNELGRTEAAIAPYCSQDPQPLFRPPNGGYDADVLAAVGAAGYGYTVTWDIDTIDWRPIKNDPPGPTADEIVTKVLANGQGGSIVLMHLGGYETFEALPRVVAGLETAGYDLVTLDQLLGT